MKYILGTKGTMTTVFTDDGRSCAATIVVAGPAVVTQVKTLEKDGYTSIQLGAIETKEKHVNKAQLGHAKGRAFKVFREFRPSIHTTQSLPASNALTGAEVGGIIDVTSFVVGDKVEVSAISKGKGFQGVVKRHGFHGGPRSHGQKHSERSPGSIGGSGGRAGGRVARGMRMAGRMGGNRTTVRNLTILQVHPNTGELVIAGAVPGRRGTLVEVRGVESR